MGRSHQIAQASSGGQPNTRSSALLETRGYRKIGHLTPHTLRRTFASLLAEVGVPPRRAMYLIGHTDPTLTMRVY